MRIVRTHTHAGADLGFICIGCRCSAHDDGGPPVEVDAKHPLWAAWDDDDWNGATAANWYSSHVRPGVRVVLTPPLSASADLLLRMTASFERDGAFVELMGGQVPCPRCT